MTATQFSKILKQLGWTQRDAAWHLGVTEGAVSRWVSGSRPIPGPVSRLMEYVKGTSKQG